MVGGSLSGPGVPDCSSDRTYLTIYRCLTKPDLSRTNTRDRRAVRIFGLRTAERSCALLSVIISRILGGERPVTLGEYCFEKIYSISYKKNIYIRRSKIRRSNSESIFTGRNTTDLVSFTPSELCTVMYYYPRRVLLRTVIYWRAEE